MRGNIVTVTVDPRVFKEIEKRRGDVPRSKYVSRIIEAAFFDQVDKNQHRLPAE